MEKIIFIKKSPYVIFRNYGDIGVLYNIKQKTYSIINSLGSDIWEYIVCSENDVQLNDIVEYISQTYKVDCSIVDGDVADFLRTLFLQNMISVNGCFDNSNVQKSEAEFESDIEKEIINHLQRKHQLYSVTFELTYNCNERCVHCYATLPTLAQKERFLNLETCKKVIDELYQMKCFHLIFTGGDPFVFDGFMDLLQYVRDIGFSFDVYTNGKAITDNVIARKIATFYPRTFYISLYGATAKVHDTVTRVPGSFESTVKSIQLLKDAGISVILNIMVMKLNYFEIEGIIKLANELDVDYRIGISIIRKNDGDNAPVQYFLDDEKTIEYVLKRTEKSVTNMDTASAPEHTGLICGAGATSVCISPNGDVYPCLSLKHKLGSIFSDLLTTIWDDSENIKYVYSLTWENTKKCKNCPMSDGCPHCIGISEAEHGDPFDCNHCDYLVAKCLFHMNNSLDA